MTKYINADALISDIKQMRNAPNGYSDTFDKSEIIGVIEEQPAADVRENVHGKWIKTIRIRKTEGTDYYDPVWFCPTCGQEYDATFASHNVKFCYRCGTDMRGEDHESDL